MFPNVVPRSPGVRADARHLPFADAAFDVIVCGPPWDNLGVLEQARPELRRVLADGGRMALVLPHMADRRAATLVFTDRDWSTSESYKVSAPRERVGPRYFSPRPEWADEVVGYVRAECDGDRMLDPFCGIGTFVRSARDAGYHAVGCDIDADALQVAVS